MFLPIFANKNHSVHETNNVWEVQIDPQGPSDHQIVDGKVLIIQGQPAERGLSPLLASPSIHFPGFSINACFWPLFTKKNFFFHKSKVVRHQKLATGDPKIKPFISQNSEIIQNNPGEKFSYISFYIFTNL